jgi:uncharacterized UBP type Zn finger protein
MSPTTGPASRRTVRGGGFEPSADSHAWWLAAWTVAGKDLQAVKGAFKVGLVNTGNSCYCNADLQMLLALPAWRELYADVRPPAREPNKDLGFQMSKLARAVSDPARFVRPKQAARDAARCETQDFVTPRVLKTLLGAGHPDFSNSEQQDAALWVWSPAHTLLLSC